MTTANSACEGSVPEFPDSITVNETTINLADDASLFKKEEITWTLGGDGRYTAPLAYTPVGVHAIWLFINGVYQEYNVDYTLTGSTLIYTGTPPAGATTICQYLSQTAGGIPAGAAGVGSIIGFASGSPPAGWLVCDGSAIDQTIYANLFAIIAHMYADDAADETALDLAGNFRLPNVDASFYDGATLVTSTAIIKY